MKTHFRRSAAACAGFPLFLAACAAPLHPSHWPPPPARAALWVDALRGEPLTFDELIGELRPARIVYLGEYHSIPRHHALETQILQALAGQGASLVLAMEQFEFTAQPALDQFNSGALDLPELVRKCDWDKRWPAHTNYHALLRVARRHAIPVLALNARAETIRTIGRRGLEGLSPEERQELPQTVITDDPVYERLLNRTLGVHLAFDPAKLRPVFEAQVARDETMAARLTAFLNSPAGQGRTALVICGQGHCQFGLGTPDRVARRDPGISQRIVLLSESGDLHLSAQERKQAREVDISHQFLRDLGRAPGDFFQVMQTAAPDWEASR
jgi:uncharacterized iron-regulated protein